MTKTEKPSLIELAQTIAGTEFANWQREVLEVIEQAPKSARVIVVQRGRRPTRRVPPT